MHNDNYLGSPVPLQSLLTEGLQMDGKREKQHERAVASQDLCRRLRQSIFTLECIARRSMTRHKKNEPVYLGFHQIHTIISEWKTPLALLALSLHP